MDFLARKQILVFTSKQYENIYIYLKDVYEIKYHDLFMLSASIGFRNNNPLPIGEKGREFRSNYLSNAQRATAYSMILNHPTVGKDLEKFNQEDFPSIAKKILEEYAEGGMQILVRDVFRSKFKDGHLDKTYEEYDLDIISYVYEQSDVVPF
jgi:hypothetical protein